MVALPRAATKVQTFVPYGSPCDDLPDPTSRAICGLLNEVEALRRRVAQLESDRSLTSSGWAPDDARPAGTQPNEGRTAKLGS